MSNKLKELRERYGKAATQALAITEGARAENRDLTPDELTKFHALNDEAINVEKQIQAEERAQEFERIKAQENGERLERNNVTEDTQEVRSKKYAEAFRRYMAAAGRVENMSAEDRTVLSAGEFEKRGTDPQSSVTDNLGGYTVPEEWMNTIYSYLAYYGPMVRIGSSLDRLGMFNNLVTANGNTIHWPKSNTTTQKGRLIGENAERNVADIPFATTPIASYGFTSDIVKVPRTLLRDTGVTNLQSHIADTLADRIGRIINDYFTTGTGTSEPQGIVTGSSLGKTAALTTAFTRDEIVQLIGEVDIAYQGRPSTSFMFNQDVLTAIRLLKVGASDARPLWQLSMRDGVPGTIEDVPYLINNSMGGLTAGSKCVLFGDMSKFITRFVGNPVIRFSTDRYFEFDQVAWVADWYGDSRMQDETAIKHLITAAT